MTILLLGNEAENPTFRDDIKPETMAAGLTKLEENRINVIERLKTGVLYPPFLVRWPSTRYMVSEDLHSVFRDHVLQGTMQPLQLRRRRWKIQTCILEIFDCILKVILLASSRDMLPVSIPSRTLLRLRCSQ